MEAVSRRDFIKLACVSAVGVLGLRLVSTQGLNLLSAEGTEAEGTKVSELPVIWLQAGGCTGCSVSFLNTKSPTATNVLVDEVVPGHHVNLLFHPTVMAASGEKALSMLDPKKEFVLVAEGAFATKDDGIYCVIGEETALKRLTELGKRAMAVIALGTCAAYGGIPAADPNPTGAKGVKKIFDEYHISTPVINVPGCPAHPDWFVGTIATILASGLQAVELDSQGRPLAFFEHRIHDKCPRRGYYDMGKFAKKLSDPYCLYQLGCKGPITHADCPTRLWNGGTNWCIGAGHPCVGCVEPGFPDDTSPFFRKISLMNDALKNDVTEWIGKGLGIAALTGVGAHLGTTAASGRFKKEEEE